MNCPNCGAKITPEDRFCGECGTPLNQNPKPSENTHHNVPKRESDSIEHQDETKKYVHPSESNDHAQQNENLSRTNRTEQTQAQQQVPPNQQQPEHRAEPQYSSIDREKFNKHAQEIKTEGLTFFKSLFTSHDSVVARKHPFNLKTILTITIVYAVLNLILLSILASAFLDGSIIFKIWLSILLFIAINLVITFGIVRLVIKDPVPFMKVFSDFIFINTFAWLFFTITLLLLTMNSSGTFFLFTFLIALIGFLNTPVYLITMYANRNMIRIPVFYGILIYIIIELIVFKITGQMLLKTLIRFLPSEISSFFNLLLDQQSNGYPGGGY